MFEASENPAAAGSTGILPVRSIGFQPMHSGQITMGGTGYSLPVCSIGFQPMLSEQTMWGGTGYSLPVLQKRKPNRFTGNE